MFESGRPTSSTHFQAPASFRHMQQKGPRRTTVPPVSVGSTTVVMRYVQPVLPSADTHASVVCQVIE